MLNVAMAAGAGLGVSQLYPHAMAGNDAASAAAMGLGAIAIYNAAKGMGAIDHYVDRYRLERQNSQAARNQGDAKLGDHKAAKKAGLRTGTGIILGQDRGRIISCNDFTGACVNAPPGGGKGTGFIGPNAALYQPPLEDEGQLPSWVYLDIAAENYCVWKNHLLSRGYDVVCLCPDVDRVSKQIGRLLPESRRHNPFGFIKVDDPDAIADVKMVIRKLQGEVKKEQHSGNSKHFEEIGRIPAVGFALHELSTTGIIHPVEIRRLTMLPAEELATLVEEMRKSDAFGGAVRSYASKIYTTLITGPEEASGMLTTAARIFEAFEPGPLANHVSEHEFDWGDLEKRPTVVFVIVPPDRLNIYERWLCTTLEMSFEINARSCGGRRKIWMLDEIGNVPRLDGLTRMIAVYRKWKLQTCIILQQGQAQLQAAGYSREEARYITGMCDVELTFGVREDEDLSRLSRLAGTRSVETINTSLGQGGVRDAVLGYGAGYQGVPLLRPETIRGLDSKKAWLFCRNAPPFAIDRLNYLTDKRCRGKFDSNPYYER